MWSVDHLDGFREASCDICSLLGLGDGQCCRSAFGWMVLNTRWEAWHRGGELVHKAKVKERKLFDSGPS